MMATTPGSGVKRARLGGGSAQRITDFFASPAPPPARLAEDAVPASAFGALTSADERARWQRSTGVNVRPDRRCRPYTAQYVSPFDDGWSAPGYGVLARRDDAAARRAPDEDVAASMAEAACAHRAHEPPLSAEERKALARVASFGACWQVYDASELAPAPDPMPSADGADHAARPLAALAARALLLSPECACAGGALLAETEELTAALSARQLSALAATLGCACSTRADTARALSSWANASARAPPDLAAAAARRLARAAAGALGPARRLVRACDAVADAQWRAQAACCVAAGLSPWRALEAALVRPSAAATGGAGAGDGSGCRGSGGDDRGGDGGGDCGGGNGGSASGDASLGGGTLAPRAPCVGELLLRASARRTRPELGRAAAAAAASAAAEPGVRWWVLTRHEAAMDAAVRAGMGDAARRAAHEASCVLLELVDEHADDRAERSPHAAARLPQPQQPQPQPQQPQPQPQPQPQHPQPQPQQPQHPPQPQPQHPQHPPQFQPQEAGLSRAHARRRDALLALTLVLRGVGLLEREAEFSAALHYLGLLLRAAPPTPAPPPSARAPVGVLGGCSAVGAVHVRIVRDLIHLGRRREALEAAERALGASETEVAGACRLGLESTVRRLAAPPLRWRAPSLPARAQAVRLTLRVPLSATGSARVEQLALDALLSSAAASAAHGWCWRGVHAENGLAHTLCTLLLWRVLHGDGAPAARGDGAPTAQAESAPTYRGERAAGARTPVRLPSAAAGLTFDSPALPSAPECPDSQCQWLPSPWALAPADLELGTFAQRRRAQLDDALGRIRRGEWRGLLAHGWSQHSLGAATLGGVRLAALSAHGIGHASLQHLCAALGGRVLAVICERLATDFRTWSHGMPDLLLWAEPASDSDADGGGPSGSGPSAAAPPPRAQLVEVKGPGDSLSNAQLAWIDVLHAAGADIRVAHVVSSAS